MVCEKLQCDVSIVDIFFRRLRILWCMFWDSNFLEIDDICRKRSVQNQSGIKVNDGNFQEIKQNSTQFAKDKY